MTYTNVKFGRTLIRTHFCFSEELIAAEGRSQCSFLPVHDIRPMKPFPAQRSSV
jgi:hypothetical protein